MVIVMDNKAIAERLRMLADKLEREDVETIRYLGEDGNMHEVPVDVRVAYLPKVANQSMVGVVNGE